MPPGSRVNSKKSTGSCNFEVGEFLLKLYRLARETPIDAFPSEMLDLVRTQCIPFDSARMGGGSLHADGHTVHYTYLLDESPELLRDYEDIKEQDTSIALLRQHGTGYQSLRFSARQLFAGRDKTGVREYTRKYGHESNMMSWHVRADDQYVHYLGTYRADRDAEFQKRDNEIMLMLLPHLLEALKVNRVIHQEQIAIGAGNHARMYQLGIADHYGVICHADSGLRELLLREWSPVPEFVLPSALMATLSSGIPYKGQHIFVNARSLHGLLFLKARALCPADKLSTREVQVASSVSAGFSYKEIAQRLSLSPVTVRNHVQAIHGKLGVRNTAELIAAIAPLN